MPGLGIEQSIGNMRSDGFTASVRVNNITSSDLIPTYRPTITFRAPVNTGDRIGREIEIEFGVTEDGKLMRDFILPHKPGETPRKIISTSDDKETMDIFLALAENLCAYGEEAFPASETRALLNVLMWPSPF